MIKFRRKRNTSKQKNRIGNLLIHATEKNMNLSNRKPTNYKLSEENIKDILKNWENTPTCTKKLANYYGVKCNTILYHVTKHGLRTRARKIKVGKKANSYRR